MTSLRQFLACLLLVPLLGCSRPDRENIYAEVIRGKLIIDRTEADEILSALSDSVAAHDAALNFYEAALKSFGPTATPQERAVMEANLLACALSSKRLIVLTKKWHQRAAELKEAK